MFEQIFKNCASIKEPNFEYYNLQHDFDVSINFIQKGTIVPPHSHEQEVFTYIFNGKIFISIDDERKLYLIGKWINIPANKIHSLEAETDAILLELWKK